MSNSDFLQNVKSPFSIKRDPIEAKIHDILRSMASGSNNNDELISFIGGAIEGLREKMQAGFTEMRKEISNSETRLTTLIKGELEQVHLRLDSIERALSGEIAQIRTEVSRLRSAVYLLAKDRPEILRMLGPGEQPF